MKEKKLIKIMYGGPIPELGHILGPIINPYKEKIETIGRLVAGGRRVFEINEDDRSKEVLLTSKNYKADNFVVEKADNSKVEQKAAEKQFTAMDTTNPTKTVDEQKEATTEQKVVNTAISPDTSKKEATTEQKSDFTKK